jgi:hypothetical protein
MTPLPSFDPEEVELLIGAVATDATTPEGSERTA